MTNYENQSLISIKWSYAGNFIPKVISPVVFFLLAFFLNPKDFGLITIAYLVISFIELTREAGLSKAIIQSDADEKTIFDMSFIINIIFGTICYTILFIAAPIIATFFNDISATSVLRILGFQIIFSSISLNYYGIINKRIDFKALFPVNLVQSACLAIVTLPLAALEYGVWSIVVGNLCASFFRVILLYRRLPWIPQFYVNRTELRKMVRFAIYCYLEAALGWIYLWGDKAILGKYVPTSTLGNYMFSHNATYSICNIMTFPLSQVIYPFLCKEKVPRLMNEVIYHTLSYFAIMSLFFGLILYHSASVLPGILGSKWSDIVFPFGMLSLSASFSMIFTYIIPDAIKAIGKPDILFKFQLIKLLYTLPAFIISACFFGVNGFCVAKLLTVIVGCCLFCWLAVHVINLEYYLIYISIKSPFFSFLISFALLLFVKKTFFTNFSPIPSLLSIVFSGLILYLLFLYILDKLLLKKFFSNCLRILPDNISRLRILKPLT